MQRVRRRPKAATATDAGEGLRPGAAGREATGAADRTGIASAPTSQADAEPEAAEARRLRAELAAELERMGRAASADRHAPP